jgi:hypothetical protein
VHPGRLVPVIRLLSAHNHPQACPGRVGARVPCAGSRE